MKGWWEWWCARRGIGGAAKARFGRIAMGIPSAALLGDRAQGLGGRGDSTRFSRSSSDRVDVQQEPCVWQPLWGLRLALRNMREASASALQCRLATPSAQRRQRTAVAPACATSTHLFGHDRCFTGCSGAH